MCKLWLCSLSSTVIINASRSLTLSPSSSSIARRDGNWNVSERNKIYNKNKNGNKIPRRRKIAKQNERNERAQSEPHICESFSLFFVCSFFCYVKVDIFILFLWVRRESRTSEKNLVFFSRKTTGKTHRAWVAVAHLFHFASNILFPSTETPPSSVVLLLFVSWNKNVRKIVWNDMTTTESNKPSAARTKRNLNSSS